MKIPKSFQKNIANTFYDTDVIVYKKTNGRDAMGAIDPNKSPVEKHWEGKGNCIPASREKMDEIFGEYLTGSYYLSLPLESGLELGDLIRTSNLEFLMEVASWVRQLTHFEAQIVIESAESLAHGE